MRASKQNFFGLGLSHFAVEASWRQLDRIAKIEQILKGGEFVALELLLF